MGIDVGDPGPDFTLRDQNMQEVTLSSFRGQKNVVLVFYPMTFTNVCKGELCTVRDALPSFENDDTTTLALSVDSSPVHRVWAEQENFGFRLLADFWPHGAVAQHYGVFDERLGLALRGTFLIDKEGVVRYKTVNPVPDARDFAELQEAVAALP